MAKATQLIQQTERWAAKHPRPHAFNFDLHPLQQLAMPRGRVLHPVLKNRGDFEELVLETTVDAAEQIRNRDQDGLRKRLGLGGLRRVALQLAIELLHPVEQGTQLTPERLDSFVFPARHRAPA